MSGLKELREITHAYNSFDYQGHLEEVSDLYHYTSLSTLQKILKERKLRFTNWAYLNDKSEGTYALVFCKEHLDAVWTWGDDVDKDNTKDNFRKKLDEAIDDVNKVRRGIDDNPPESYQASFSYKPDSLTMWNYYAQGQGCSLQFLNDLIENFRNRLLKPDGMSLIFLHGNVIYKDDKKIEILRDIFDYFKSCSPTGGVDTLYACLIECILKMGAFFKHSGFEDEREYRIVFNLRTTENSNKFIQLVHPENGDPYKREVYSKQGMLVPYVDVDFDLKHLQSISVSPTTNFEKVQTGINIMLFEQGVSKGQIPINQSAIPLRF